METATQRLSRLYGLDKKRKTGSTTDEESDSSSGSLSLSGSGSGSASQSPSKRVSVVGFSSRGRGGGASNGSSRGSNRGSKGKAEAGGAGAGKADASKVTSNLMKTGLTTTTVATTTVAPSKKWGLLKINKKKASSSPSVSEKSDVDFVMELGNGNIKVDRSGKDNGSVKSQRESQGERVRHVTFGGAWEVEPDSDSKRKIPISPPTKNSDGARKSQLKKTVIHAVATGSDQSGKMGLIDAAASRNRSPTSVFQFRHNDKK